MAECKLLEIRDQMTFIPAMAVQIKIEPDNPISSAERYLMRQVGYPASELEKQRGFVLLIRLTDKRQEFRPVSWGSATMGSAHEHIIQAWNSLESGDVVDVQFLAGEHDSPVKSERLD